MKGNNRRLVEFVRKDNTHFFTPLKHAIENFKLIEPGDKVAIGMSGGKDSTSLLYFLHTIKTQKRLGFDDFELHPVALDTRRDMDLTPLKEFCESLGYGLEVVHTDIAEVVFDIRKEKNPCSLCANMRRGSLYSTCQERGYNKVALGHHLDDAIETFMMNFLLHGRCASFAPATYMTKTGVTVIRPMIYIEEKDIKNFVRREQIPVIFNPCPVDKKTTREDMKTLVKELGQQYPMIKQKFLSLIESPDKAEFWQIEAE